MSKGFVTSTPTIPKMPRGRGWGKIPTGFNQSARRCEERATLGHRQNKIKTPTGFHQTDGGMLQLLQS
jgi:hypothetical protein